ncbi:transposase family protein [Streptomyces sp. NPDC127079]|uniref:transposase family protein n=1 Tax=Streptomyces sp. NPDC127079 TaxID=3347132 RepID=UPI0036574454
MVLIDGTGRLIWISAARPGRTHDNTAARHDHMLAHLRAAGLGALADLGFRGLDTDVLDPVIVTGFHASRTHRLTSGQKTANYVIAIGRAPVEHGFAHLKNWRTLTKLRTDPARATHLLRALLVLTNREVGRSRMPACAVCTPRAVVKIFRARRLSHDRSSRVEERQRVLLRQSRTAAVGACPGAHRVGRCLSPTRHQFSYKATVCN